MGISQITTCMGRKSHVLKNISRWLSTDIDELVVVDYGCPEQITKELIPYADRDPRITLVQVSPSAAKTFHLTKARNIGAQAARYELLFFCDADAWTTQFFMEKIRQKFDDGGTDLMVSDLSVCGEVKDTEGLDLPLSWCTDGQCILRNPLFYMLNGYNERFAEWGAESYDLYTRCLLAGAKVAEFGERAIHTTPHDDHMRDKFHEEKWSDLTNGRLAQFRRSMHMLERWRKHDFRANAGMTMGMPMDPSGNVIIRYKAGRSLKWAPGEVD